MKRKLIHRNKSNNKFTAEYIFKKADDGIRRRDKGSHLEVYVLDFGISTLRDTIFSRQLKVGRSTKSRIYEITTLSFVGTSPAFEKISGRPYKTGMLKHRYTTLNLQMH